MKFNVNIMNLLKRDITPIFFLLSLTIATRVIMIINAPFVYHIDSYAFIKQAIDLSSRGEIQFGVRAPFIITLGLLIYIFGSTLGAIMISRLLMLLMSALIVCVVYLFGLRISGKVLGFLASLIAIFETFFLTYSIVPHSDVFAVAIGLAAMYLATSRSIKFSYVLSLFFFYIAIVTRPEYFVLLIFPILIFSFSKHLKVVSVRNVIASVFLGSLYVVPVVWVATTYPTRFDIIEKFSLFFRPELLKSTLESLFEFYDQAFLNQIFFALVVLGVGWPLLNILGKFVVFEKRGKIFSVKRVKETRIRDVFLSDKILIVFCLFLLFLTDIIVLTLYGYGYVIVEGTIIIRKWFPERYLILSRLLLSYPLAYVLSMFVQKVYSEMPGKIISNNR